MAKVLSFMYFTLIMAGNSAGVGKLEKPAQSYTAIH